MKVDVKYFGVIAEVVGKEKEELFLEEEKKITDLTEFILSLYPNLQSYVFKFSVNQEIVENDDVELEENDEVALLPPYAGG